MQTSVKKVKLRGHEFESEVTVRHRSTLGRYEASLKEHPHLTGEGDTEPEALDDLSTMLSSDPDAHDQVEAKNEEAKDKAREDEKAAKAEAKKTADDAKDNPPAAPRAEDADNPPAAEEKAGGADKPETDDWGTATTTKTGEASDTLAPTDGATITKG